MVRTCEGESDLNVKDANRGLARIGAGPLLDTCELSRRELQAKPIWPAPVRWPPRMLFGCAPEIPSTDISSPW